MPVINIQSLAKPTTLVTANDSANPYSFQQWKQYNNNIDTRAQIDQYNTYLKNWYKARANTPQAMFQYVRKTYTDFLKQLGLSTRNPEEQTFFSIINYSDDLDIQGAVTYFARKLKDVSRYIAERRSNIVYSKLKYNQLGTNGYLEGLFYSYILSVFTQRPDSGNAGLVVSNGNLLQYLPNLNDISDSFSIEIEELYDIANYHDRDPSVSINWYTTFAADTYSVLYNTSLYEAPTQYLLGLIIQALNTANTLNPCYGVTGFVGTSVSNNMANSSNVYIYAGDGYTTTYALNNITQTDGGMYRVTIDGLFQTPYNAYKISVQNSNLVFSEAPPAGAEIVIITPS